MLSDRDVANLLWLLVPAAVLSLVPQVRQAAARVIAAMLAAPIVVTIGIAAAYVGGWLWLFEKIGLWRLSDWPTTLLWFFGTALVSIFTTKEYAERPVTLWELMGAELGVVIIVQAIAGAYSLPFALEFALVPVIFILGVVGVRAASNAKTTSIALAANSLLALIAIGFFMNGVVGAIHDLANFKSVEPVRVFLMPIALSVSLTPALLALALYLTFERLGTKARYVFPNEPLRRYAIRRAVLAFRFSPTLVERFFVGLHRGSLPDRTSVDTRLLHLREILRREADPPAVDAAEGWSPYLASRFLATEGLEARNWRETGDRWSANAPARNIGKTRYSAFFEYFVEGDEHVARRLRLVGYALPAEDKPPYRERFVSLALALAEAAIGEDARASLAAPLQAHAPFELLVQNRFVSFRIDNEGAASGASTRVMFKLDYRMGYELPA